MLYQAGKSDIERTMIVNALGHKWELTFTTLVTFGGAFFRIVSPVLRHQLRRRILGMDTHSFLFHNTGRIVRIPLQSRQPSGQLDIRGIPDNKRLRATMLLGVVVATLYRQRILDSDELRQRPCQPDMGRRVRRTGTGLRPVAIYHIHKPVARPGGDVPIPPFWAQCTCVTG